MNRLFSDMESQSAGGQAAELLKRITERAKTHKEL